MVMVRFYRIGDAGLFEYNRQDVKVVLDEEFLGFIGVIRGFCYGLSKMSLWRVGVF